jgi:hypothetical protein
VADVVAQHIAHCKQLPFLRYAHPIIIPESNLPMMAMELQNKLKHTLQVNCTFMTEDKSHAGALADLPGSYTTRQNKLEMVYSFIEHYLKTDRVVFHQDFVVAVSESMMVTASPGNIQKLFVRQLRDFARIKKYRVDKDGTTLCEFFFSGKNSGSNNDDFVMALLIAILMHKRFWSKDKYKNVRSL